MRNILLQRWREEGTSGEMEWVIQTVDERPESEQTEKDEYLSDEHSRNTALSRMSMRWEWKLRFDDYYQNMQRFSVVVQIER